MIVHLFTHTAHRPSRCPSNCNIMPYSSRYAGASAVLLNNTGGKTERAKSLRSRVEKQAQNSHVDKVIRLHIQFQNGHVQSNWIKHSDQMRCPMCDPKWAPWTASASARWDVAIEIRSIDVASCTDPTRSRTLPQLAGSLMERSKEERNTELSKPQFSIFINTFYRANIVPRCIIFATHQITNGTERLDVLVVTAYG